MKNFKNLDANKVAGGFDFLNRIKAKNNYIESLDGNLFLIAIKDMDLYMYDLKLETKKNALVELKNMQLPKINKIMKHFNKDNLNIDIIVKKETVIIKNKKRSINIDSSVYNYGLIKDYDIKDRKIESDINLTGEKFKNIIDKLDNTRDKKGTREKLSGIIVGYDGFVSLDGYKLGKIKNNNYKNNDKKGYILNKNIIDSLKKILVKHKDLSYNIIEYKNRIIIKNNDFKVITYNKKYNDFNYNDVIRDKKNDEVTIKIETKKINDGNNFILDSAEYSMLELSNEMKLSGINKSNIVSSLLLDEVINISKNIKIGYNPKYFKDIISNINNNYIELGFLGEFDPIMFRSEDYIGLLLPVRLNI